MGRIFLRFLLTLISLHVYADILHHVQQVIRRITQQRVMPYQGVIMIMTKMPLSIARHAPKAMIQRLESLVLNVQKNVPVPMVPTPTNFDSGINIK